ncbi:plant-specific domain TIGR01589 family protein [Musa troglodytarum]|uniref:Plant-specific domain TIGR01589 family protein n=1 Tax=Musa troglodytarum TaxID=320322 RepID=A0A9E7KY30_9LILI|nr:plant-specific domain TIGR01589 family protein [Musa troglodytarum]
MDYSHPPRRVARVYADRVWSSVVMGDSSSSSPASYIRMVQHLIEKCLLFHMSKEECVEALSKHANIKPVITATVWAELEKENKEFFEAYSKNREESVMEMRSMQMIRTTLTRMASRDPDEDED